MEKSSSKKVKGKAKDDVTTPENAPIADSAAPVKKSKSKKTVDDNKSAAKVEESKEVHSASTSTQSNDKSQTAPSVDDSKSKEKKQNPSGPVEKVFGDKPRKYKNFGAKTTAAKAMRGIDLTGKNILITGASSGIGMFH